MSNHFKLNSLAAGRSMLAFSLVTVLCTACVKYEALPESSYVCSPEQRERAQVEAQREIQIEKAWSSFARKEIYSDALKRNCAVTP